MWNTFIDFLEKLIGYAYRAFEWLYTEPQRIAVEWREHANRRSLIMIVAGGSAALGMYMYAIAPPEQFPIGLLVSVPEGTTASEIGEILQSQGVVQQSIAFRAAIMLLGRDRDVRAGDYLFKEPKDVISVARVITTGAFGLEPLRFRVAEGATTYEMAKLLSAQLQRFDGDAFIEAAQPFEGYLFPDTYFFLPNATEETVLNAMRQNFDVQIATLNDEIAKSGKSLNDIVIMASILEREARTYEDRRMIAGVLWRRLKINMALQVDAAFLYSIGRTTFTLTKDDLRNADDPYNTYVNKGLPPGAIGSPSLSSLQAAVNPIDKGYLFYLADNSNVTHYSKTYEEHLRLKALYLGS
mgnify:CR=1 FL=1